MKRILLSIALIISAGMVATAQPEQNSKTKWFEDAGLGMFVHFGPYSVLADGEWVMNSRPIAAADYMRLQNLFDPEEFDAAAWVAAAKSAGARYITFTSRHHDGFSNWATKQSDWNIMNTPYGKDILRQLADECHKEGIKLVLYYSLLDWMRTDYQWQTGRTGQHSERTGPSDWDSYIAFMKAQLTELLTEYGPIAGIWFDGHWDQTENENRADQNTKTDWHYPEIYGLIKSLQPDCLVANNHHVPTFPGEDYQIFERDVPGANESGFSGQAISKLPLETCETINGSWGFRIVDDEFKSDKELIHLLVRSAGMGANLLLNVGPMGNGQIQPESIERLAKMGEWMKKFGHTIYATDGTSLNEEWGTATRSGNTYYIHVLAPETRAVEMTLSGVKSAKMLDGGVPVKWKSDRRSGVVTFYLPEGIDHTDAIVEVTMKK